MPEQITLNFSYATRAGLDQSLTLYQLTPGDYTGPVVELRQGRWYLQAAAGQWRVTGQVTVPGSGRADLAPAPEPRR